MCLTALCGIVLKSQLLRAVSSLASNCSRMSGGRLERHSVRVLPAATQLSRGRDHGYSCPSRHLQSSTGARCARPPGGARLRSAGGCSISDGSGPLSLQPRMPGLLQPHARCNPEHPWRLPRANRTASQIPALTVILFMDHWNNGIKGRFPKPGN